ncbi:MAG: hypothetical protein ABJE10_15390 [bacterium]
MPIKSLLAGMGVALISACSGGPTAPSVPSAPSALSDPSAAPSAETRGIVPAARNNSGYVVAERDSSGANAMGMLMRVVRRLPLGTPSSGNGQ